ncbi:MAG: hypothetical protein A2991_01200 [Candidatus Terrybacteria bacterium RIFCSPLOWO2_01_FULL_58_14]|uniref:Uncharacterized protein n=1 Tax=Candidatus Terrybacteria bacterium RIFCSPLOWO2_01_FULL_58_14 TaxID=1802369 RepID=A0A1G2Q2I0_9BACT|nr:MAG: hypothetical protein A2991_01200 [Candidatus Terrybacteria bacterium RIFCSPLOWO2_01_FULL_58_14]
MGLIPVEVSPRRLRDYEGVAPAALLAEIRKLARGLRGRRVAHVNATSKGGGVAEMLQSLVPLMQDVGLDASWYVLPPMQEFFAVTKKIHNLLQGKSGRTGIGLSRHEKGLYLRHNQKIAGWMGQTKADVWVVHDPQPAAVIESVNRRKAKFIGRVHIDTTKPHPATAAFFSQFWCAYDRVFFSLEDFILDGIPRDIVRIVYPAIDPLAQKNQPLRPAIAATILRNLGVDVERPILAQISRFDPWKDPEGVIDAYRMVKRRIPAVQLLLVGLIVAQDDPEAAEILSRVERHARGDPDIFLFADPAQLGPLTNDLFVNAVQVGADVVFQKSLREGFGMTVTEAMWKRKPVIGGNTGGIRVQIDDGVNGFLVSSIGQAAERAHELLRNRELRQKMGRRARTRVRQRFLLPRLLHDYLEVLRGL